MMPGSRKETTTKLIAIFETPVRNMHDSGHESGRACIIMNDDAKKGSQGQTNFHSVTSVHELLNMCAPATIIAA